VGYESVMEEMRENWFKTFTIRDFHLQCYNEKKKADKEARRSGSRNNSGN
jgi:hypothetical protein